MTVDRVSEHKPGPRETKRSNPSRHHECTSRRQRPAPDVHSPHVPQRTTARDASKPSKRQGSMEIGISSASKLMPQSRKGNGTRHGVATMECHGGTEHRPTTMPSTMSGGLNGGGSHSEIPSARVQARPIRECESKRNLREYKTRLGRSAIQLTLVPNSGNLRNAEQCLVNICHLKSDSFRGFGSNGHQENVSLLHSQSFLHSPPRTPNCPAALETP